MNNEETLLWCFKSIIQFNETGGNKVGEVDPLLERKMINSELKELFEDGILAGDPKETMDGAGDVMVVFVGTIWKLGLWDKFPAILKAICESNMSKFCDTEEEAKDTVDHYKDLGVETSYTLVEKYNKYVIKDTKGKILKSIKFKKPVFNV